MARLLPKLDEVEFEKTKACRLELADLGPGVVPELERAIPDASEAAGTAIIQGLVDVGVKHPEVIKTCFGRIEIKRPLVSSVYFDALHDIHEPQTQRISAYLPTRKGTVWTKERFDQLKQLWLGRYREKYQSREEDKDGKLKRTDLADSTA